MKLGALLAVSFAALWAPVTAHAQQINGTPARPVPPSRLTENNFRRPIPNSAE